MYGILCIDLAYFVSFQTAHGIANGQVSQISKIGPEFDPVSVTKKGLLIYPKVGYLHYRGSVPTLNRSLKFSPVIR